MIEIQIPIVFLSKAATLLAETNSGLSGTKIVDIINAYADQWGVSVPYPSGISEAPNKRTALLESLKAFSSIQQFQIIEELCDHYSFTQASTSKVERQKLKAELFVRFGHLRQNKELRELDLPLVTEAKHWLASYPKALSQFDQAKLKYDGKLFQRSLVDDLRLTLELFLREILQNTKSLENQINPIGLWLKDRGASPQFNNMLQKLIDLYCKYQNENVKHDDKMPEAEVEFIFEITASFIKHIARVAN